MNNILKPKILLESGTNELELMEFTIAGSHFGINVAKILEIMKYTKATAMPNSSPYVEGVFKPRDDIMTVINLAKYMGLEPSEDSSRDIFIITIFNNVYSAFHVHTVEEIHRISWENIEQAASDRSSWAFIIQDDVGYLLGELFHWSVYLTGRHPEIR